MISRRSAVHMSSFSPLTDAVQRERALDVSRSFIVQAPAGSGKTELLIQRLLALLGGVEEPEEVVAITFTRKAAGEMRQRVLDALEIARTQFPPAESHSLRTWTLARAVLHRDESLNWGLLDSPSRLRIQTIDSLCASLCRQMPLLAASESQLMPTEDPSPLYIEAARSTLALLDEDSQWSEFVARVLMHLDNDFLAAETLLVGMLRRRDQWLRYVVDRTSGRLERNRLEQSLTNLIHDELMELRACFPMQFADELLELARFAASNVSPEKTDVFELAHIRALPGVSEADLPVWRGVAALLLTNVGALRKRVDSRDGFPTSKEKSTRQVFEDRKSRMMSMLSQLVDHERFLEALNLVRELPPGRFSAGQWEVLGALVELLPVLVAQLNLVFNKHAQTDFTALALAAVHALGTDEEPTDLALTLDYRVRHLLVDEFQDTSHTQYELLRRLTMGWQSGDGRTLFLVGDPMQSIYRFRDAEVGLYLRARRAGIGTVELTSLTLRANFRSQPALVSWFNECFARLLPHDENLETGAVPFSKAEAVRDDAINEAITVHPMAGKSDLLEAQRVVGIVQEALSINPNEQIAILVSSRNHLTAILPALREACVPVQAIEIESLANRQVVQDLVALTRALLHPADRIAWLGMLRAPWCGLGMADMEVVAKIGTGSPSRPILDVLRDPDALDSISEDGRSRVIRLAETLAGFVANSQRVPTRRWIEGAWMSLGGPATCRDLLALEDAAAFFELLDEVEFRGSDIELTEIQRDIKRLFARPDPRATNSVQVMTIHKAKGLEFDTVILPGLGSKRRHDGPQLLRWLERTRLSGESDLLLAPIEVNHDSDDRIFAALKRLESARSHNEEVRLLYVATTRAKSRLHLLGHLNQDASGDVRALPNSGSLLARLWPVIEDRFQTLIGSTSAAAQDVPRMQQLRRLPVSWELPAPMHSVRPKEVVQASVSAFDLEFSWASEIARKVGVIVHRALQQIAEEGVTLWGPERVKAASAVFERELRSNGVPENRLHDALERTLNAITMVLDDWRGRWILSPHHDAKSELRMTGVLDHAILTVAMDRTFVDAQGVRWIIDYKTSAHEGSNPERFLDNERERYRGQLERYAALLRLSGESRPIRLALYFPLQQGWREWEHNIV